MIKNPAIDCLQFLFCNMQNKLKIWRKRRKTGREERGKGEGRGESVYWSENRGKIAKF
jgi:hypothetical protein